MKILVIGGNGFIGSHLCESLVNLDYDVTSWDIIFDSNSDHVDCKKTVVDITKNDSVGNRLGNYDLVIHLAAVSRVEDAQADPIRCFQVNVLGVLRILESLKNSKTKLIFSSSREVYGEPKEIPVKESYEKNPSTIYGNSKLVAEQLLKTYRKLYGLDYITLRLTNVYGSPRDLRLRVIPRFIELSKKGSPLTINGGKQVIDFMFIDDVVDGITKVVNMIDSGKDKLFGKEYNFASGIGTSVGELAKIIKKIFDSNSQLSFNKERTYDVQNYIGDYNKARLDFSFEPKHTLLEGFFS